MKSRIIRRLAFGFLLAFCAVESWAQHQPTQAPLPNLDVREGRVVAAAAPTDKTAAVAALRASVPGLRVDFDTITASPRHISASGNFLTGPAGKGATISAASLAGFTAGDSNRVTKAFIKEHRALFGHGPEVLAQARVIREDVTAHNGMRSVVWEQRVDGVPVFQASLIAHTTRRGELISLSSRMVPDAEAAANRGTPNRAALLAAAEISAREAVARAAQNIGDEIKPDAMSATGEAAIGAERRQKFTAPGLKGESSAKLIWLPMDRATLRLCWDVILVSARRGEMFRVLVDARSGEVLIRQGLTHYATEATYRVFTSDSPSPFSPGHATPLTNQPPLVARALVTLPALDTNASPAGWIPDGGNQTLGNNVDAHTDLDADDVPDLPRPQGSPLRVFDFPMDLNVQEPVGYMPAAVVQLFYLCNWYHDRLYQLGFTEAAGNFQSNNFARGGLGNDAIQADAQDGSGTDNANFSTPPDGSPGRMQMYVFSGMDPRRDGDLDAEIVFHEYTHGLSWRLVGGGMGLGTAQSDGMGEGWSDFYSLALLSEAGDDVNGCYASGGYASYRIGGPADTQNYYFGIRRYPYSTDFAKNPLTFNDIDPAQADNCASGAPYHTGMFGGCTPGIANEVHDQGEVWCVMLWEARARLVTKYGWAVGNELILQLVTDGLKLTPPSPNFIQARDAILQADLVNNSGVNRNELWAAFARRGLGFSATSPDSGTTSGVQEAFDLPDNLRIAPAHGFTSRGPVGGPFDITSLTFALTNSGTNTFAWALNNATAWLEVSPAGGMLVPGDASAAVTATVTSAASTLPMGIYAGAIWFTNLASQVAQERAFQLRVGQPDYFTEQFNVGDNDLAFKSFTFTPDGSPSFYAGCVEAATEFPIDPAGGVTVLLGDDDYAFVSLSGTNTVAIYQRRTGVFFIGSNGYLTMDTGDDEYAESFAGHFAQPRISALFDDLNPESGGTISWKQLDDRVAVTFLAVPEFDVLSHRNSFQIEMFFDGRIRVTYLQVGIADGLAGLSAGLGLPAGFDESDLSGLAECAPPDSLVVAPGAGLVSLGYEGGPFTPTNADYLLRNAGSNALIWSAGVNQPWLSLSASTGQLAVTATTNATLWINAQANLLAPGSYDGAAAFTNHATGFIHTRKVSLRVKAIPGEIEVLDSIPSADDLQMPFGPVFTGVARTERITVTNSDPVHGLIISDVSFGAFHEDFDDGIAQDWSPANPAEWQVVSGEYRAQSAGISWMISRYAGQEWSDLTVQVSCRRTGSGGNAAAVVFRATPDFEDGIGSAYVFQIGIGGDYAIWKQVNGTWSWLQGWTPSPAITNGTNILKATAQGDALSFYINGTPVWSGTDTDLTSGLIAVSGYSEPDFQATHYFDNVVVSDARPAALVGSRQKWCNEHASTGGQRGLASAAAVAPYPGGTNLPDSANAPTQAALTSGPFTLTNLPALPFTVSPGGSVTFEVIYRPTATESNETKLSIASNDADEPRVAVQLTGLGILDYLQVTPATGFAARGHPGGPFSPATTNYLLENLGPEPIGWAVADMPAWVNVNPASGTLASSNSISVTVGFSAAANALGEGVHVGAITFSNLTTTARQSRNVTLSVFTSPMMVVTPGSMSVTNVLGSVAYRSLQVSNALTADGQLTFHAIGRETGRTNFNLAAADVGLPPAGHDFTKVGAAPHSPDRVLVRFTAGASKEQRAQALNRLGGARVVREYRLVPGLCLVKLPDGQALARALQALNGTPGVLYAEPDYTLRVTATVPNDALFAQLWGMNNTGQTGGTPGADINAPEAWDLNTGSRRTVVAVIDTGVDYTHPDLVKNLWTNPGEIPDNGLDDDHNGFVDDVHGFDFVNGDGHPMDDHGHGTHCSGTIGAEGNNTNGVVGVCWQARIMGLKFLDDSGSGSTADALSCVEYAVVMGAKVLNNSWGGGPYEQSLKDAIDASGAAGVVFVAAAGNEGDNADTTPHYPASYTSSNLVSVMSVDGDDVRSSFSNYGLTNVDLGAPGGGILSCAPGGGYQFMSGTSMAAPHVSGACALLLSANPLLGVDALKEALLSTVDPTLAGQCVSGGRLNLARAVSIAGASWIALSPTGGTNVGPGSAVDVTVGFHAGELPSGTYSGEIVVSGNDLINPTASVPVTMTILPEDLQIVPAGVFASTGAQGGPFVPASTTFLLTNRGAAMLDWAVGHAQSWVEVTPSSGALAGGQSASVTVAIAAAADLLPAGEFADTLMFSNTVSGAVQRHNLTLEVLTPSLSVIDAGALEGNSGSTNLTLRVQLTPASRQTISVEFTTRDGTAQAGTDYLPTNGILVFEPGQILSNVVVPVLGDTDSEPNETFAILLSNPTNAVLGLSTGTGTILSDDLPPDVYLRSIAAAPWESTANETAMDRVFGTNNWQDLRFETVLPAGVFSPATRFVYLDGSDHGALGLQSFLTTNQPLIQEWVAAGGRLFLNAAPNEGTGMNFGFGVTLLYSELTATDNAAAAAPMHPIFTRPFTPVGTAWTGDSFGHAVVIGTNLTALITNSATGSMVLGEHLHGAGLALFGGMTTDNFHSPQPQAANLRANIIDYAARFVLCTNCPPALVVQPADQNVRPGTTAAFCVTARGTAPLGYQWRKDGTNLANGAQINGTTERCLTITGLTESDSGNYAVLVTNAFGSVLSSNAALFVSRLDHFTWNAIASPQLAGTAFQVTITARDEDNAVVSNFHGRVSLAGFGSGGQITNRLLDGQIHDNSASGILTWGYSFTPGNNLTVTHVRHYFGTKAGLWTATGDLLASQDVVGPAGTWGETALTTPIELTAGTRYVVTAYAPNTTYFWMNYTALGFPDGTIDESLYSTFDNFPTVVTSGGWPMVGLRYTAASALPLPLTISPMNSSVFASGFWTGYLTALDPTTNLFLVASAIGEAIGQSNPFEVMRSAPVIMPLASGPGQAGFRYATQPGWFYTVEFTSKLEGNIRDTVWTPLQTTPGDGTTQTFSDSPTPGDPQRFYRLRIHE